MGKAKQADNVTPHPRAGAYSLREKQRKQGQIETKESCESVLSSPDCIDGVDSGTPHETEHVGRPAGSALDSPESMIEAAERAKRKQEERGKDE